MGQPAPSEPFPRKPQTQINRASGATLRRVQSAQSDGNFAAAVNDPG